jgi:hypothetical protein
MTHEEDKPNPEGSGYAAAEYSYPCDLARFVRERWRDELRTSSGVEQVHKASTLEEFFAACYQASMLREEERPVIFRAVLAEPSLFDPRGRPPESLQRFAFPLLLPFDQRELRRLSVATDPQRTLIGVWRDGDVGLQIWGLVNSGTRWLRDVQGGRRAGAPLPPELVVRVNSPGCIEVYKGHELLGKLQGGRISGSRMDPFGSKWLPDQFSGFLKELTERHVTARNRAHNLSCERWAPLETSLAHRIAERAMKRVISVLRDARHGGAVIFIPHENTGELSSGDYYIDLRYSFADDPARLCFPDLIVDILNRLAQLYGTTDHQQELVTIGWEEFESTTDPQIEILDEAIFDVAHLISGLAAADGAVIIGKNMELLGFGGMISGRLPNVKSVWKALDIEGVMVLEEGTANVGARHNSAYRIVEALPGSVAVVVSQDGGVRFMCKRGDHVIYWEQE